MSRVAICDDAIDVEYFIDLLEQMNIEYTLTKKSIQFKTPKEFLDEGVPVPLELEDSVLLHLMLMAHERNITFNKLCNQVLREQIEQFENEKSLRKTKGIRNEI